MEGSRFMGEETRNENAFSSSGTDHLFLSLHADWFGFCAVLLSKTLTSTWNRCNHWNMYSCVQSNSSPTWLTRSVSVFWYKSYYYMANNLSVGAAESEKPTDPTIITWMHLSLCNWIMKWKGRVQSNSRVQSVRSFTMWRNKSTICQRTYGLA